PVIVRLITGQLLRVDVRPADLAAAVLLRRGRVTVEHRGELVPVHLPAVGLGDFDGPFDLDPRLAHLRVLLNVWCECFSTSLQQGMNLGEGGNLAPRAPPSQRGGPRTPGFR